MYLCGWSSYVPARCSWFLILCVSIHPFSFLNGPHSIQITGPNKIGRPRLGSFTAGPFSCLPLLLRRGRKYACMTYSHSSYLATAGFGSASSGRSYKAVLQKVQRRAAILCRPYFASLSSSVVGLSNHALFCLVMQHK